MRYEYKYVVQHMDYEQLKSRILIHPAGFRIAFPDRRINSQYFDDINFSAALDNLSGSPQRAKYRIRWYGEIEFPVKAKIEKKVKRGNLGYKENEKITLSGFEDLKLSGIDSSHLQPVSCVCYLRTYLVSFNQKVRVTIDRDVRYAKFASYNHWIPDKNLILEIKCDEGSESELESVVDALQLRRNKNSKYIRSMIGVYS